MNTFQKSSETELDDAVEFGRARARHAKANHVVPQRRAMAFARGFTMIELVVAQTILVLIIAAALTLYMSFGRAVYERRAQTSQLGAASAIRGYLTYRVQTMTNVPGQSVGNTVRVVDGGGTDPDGLILLGARVEPEFAAPISIAWVSNAVIGFQAVVEERCESLNPDLTTCPAVADRDFQLVCTTPPAWSAQQFHMYATTPGGWSLFFVGPVAAAAFAVSDAGWQDNPTDLVRSPNDCNAPVTQASIPPFLIGMPLLAGPPVDFTAMSDATANVWWASTGSVVAVESFTLNTTSRMLFVEVDFSGVKEPLGENVEDFQIALGIEDNGVAGLIDDGTALDEWWGNAPVVEVFPADQSNLQAIRIGLTLGYNTRNFEGMRPVLFNRVAGAVVESKIFDQFSTTVALRNRGL